MVRKVSVVGGSGFVGTNLCQVLHDKNCDFEIIDRKLSQRFPDKCKIADIRDLATLRGQITGDIVVLLAAAHRDDIARKSDYYDTNVGGTQNITDICTELGVKKIIFASTVAVYKPSVDCVDEHGLVGPFNEYGKTKFKAEEILRNWSKLEDNSVIIVRPTVIFGEGNRGNVFNLFNQIENRRFVMVGSGANKKSMAYVLNVAAFFYFCINLNVKYQLVNYTDHPSLSMNELVDTVKRKLGIKEIFVPRLPYNIGLLFGLVADICSKLTGKKFPISSIRIKKFVTPSEFTSNNNHFADFNAPYDMIDGIDRTLNSEFISPDPNRETYFTE